MNKKQLTAFTLFTMTISVGTIANANFYAGISAGTTIPVIDTQVTYPVGTTPLTSSQNKNAAFLGTAQLSLGYHHILNQRWGIDAVVNGEANGGNIDSRITNWFDGHDALVTTQLPNVLSLNLLATIQVAENVAVFFGPGFANAQFKATAGSTGGSVGSSGNFSKNLNGVRFSVGTDFFINKTWRIRASDAYTNYSSVTWSATEPYSGQVVSSRYSPSSNTLLFGLIASF